MDLHNNRVGRGKKYWAFKGLILDADTIGKGGV